MLNECCWVGQIKPIAKLMPDFGIPPPYILTLRLLSAVTAAFFVASRPAYTDHCNGGEGWRGRTRTRDNHCIKVDHNFVAERVETNVAR
jgi:hypothetical protein